MKIDNKIILLFFLINLIFINKVFSQEKKVLNFESDDWCPYTCDEKSEIGKGIFVEIAEQIFKNQNYNVHFELMPWARVLKRGEKGEIDGIVGAYKEGREQFIFPKEPFIQSINSFLVKNNSTWKYKDFESLKNIHLGLILGYIYGGNLANIKKYAKKISESGGENAIQKNLVRLNINEIDANLDEHNVLVYHLNKMEFNKSMKFVGDLGKKSGLYLGFPKEKPNSQKLADIFDKGIINLKKTGEYKKILNKYGITTKN
ncbi:substrate-binding periplasmic protein [Fluviispira vulneris]|uniref:substrate-binding periplasmic protein n=1 Tax=Fluviispira vulneris TaxID=2763012 RepID=UPI001644D666|nr:transporter substrate-binding domain-containing protein [Fluviispira vulneris]